MVKWGGNLNKAQLTVPVTSYEWGGEESFHAASSTAWVLQHVHAVFKDHQEAVPVDRENFIILFCSFSIGFSAYWGHLFWVRATDIDFKYFN